MVEQFTLPGIPKKPGRRPTSNLSHNERVKLKARKHRERLRAEGLRSIMIWVPEAVLQAATEAARKKDKPRDHYLAEKITAMFLHPEKKRS